jgi:hypothetical protein
MSSIPPDTAPVAPQGDKPDPAPVAKVAARPLTIRYLGFECTSEGRSYRLRVDAGLETPRLYTVAIPNEAFATRRARFQDAPELCFERLQRELEANAELPAEIQLVITSADLDRYRDSQSRRSSDKKPRAPQTPR